MTLKRRAKRFRAFLRQCRNWLRMGTQGYSRFINLQSTEPLLFLSNGLEHLTPVERASASLSDFYAHVPTLQLLSTLHGTGRILELGTRRGDSTLALLAAAARIKGHVTSVDIQPVPVAQKRIHDAGYSSFWTFRQADDTTLDWHEPIDHLFIDTSHEYRHTLTELRKYEPFVDRGGLITMHDTVSYPDVWRAISEYFAGRRDVEVFRYFNNNGLAVIWKRGDPDPVRPTSDDAP